MPSATTRMIGSVPLAIPMRPCDAGSHAHCVYASVWSNDVEHTVGGYFTDDIGTATLQSRPAQQGDGSFNPYSSVALTAGPPTAHLDLDLQQALVDLVWAEATATMSMLLPHASISMIRLQHIVRNVAPGVYEKVVRHGRSSKFHRFLVGPCGFNVFSYSAAEIAAMEKVFVASNIGVPFFISVNELRVSTSTRAETFAADLLTVERVNNFVECVAESIERNWRPLSYREVRTLQMRLIMTLRDVHPVAQSLSNLQLQRIVVRLWARMQRKMGPKLVE